MTIFSVIFSPCELPSLWPRPRSQFGRHCYQCWCYFVSASADCHNSDVAHSICLLGNSVARSGGIKWTWGMEHGAWSRRQGSGGTPLRQTRLPGLWLLAQLLLALFFWPFWSYFILYLFGASFAILCCDISALASPATKSVLFICKICKFTTSTTRFSPPFFPLTAFTSLPPQSTSERRGNKLRTCILCTALHTYGPQQDWMCAGEYLCVCVCFFCWSCVCWCLDLQVRFR